MPIDVLTPEALNLLTHLTGGKDPISPYSEPLRIIHNYGRWEAHVADASIGGQFIAVGPTLIQAINALPGTIERFTKDKAEREAHARAVEAGTTERRTQTRWEGED